MSTVILNRADQFTCIEYKGQKIALTICEDLWNNIDNPIYKTFPMDVLILQNPDLMINIAASPFAVNHDQERMQVLSYNAKKYALPLLYVNHVGAQTELIFDGGSMVYDANGQLFDELAYFKEQIAYYNIEKTGVKEASIKAEKPLNSRMFRA